MHAPERIESARAWKATRVVITGAGSGLGRAIAERLARDGADVIGTVRDPEVAAQRSASAARAGLRLAYAPLELTRPAQAEALARRLLDDGGVDALVLNAGFGIFGPVEETEAAAAQAQLTVNLLAQAELLRLLLPSLRARRGRVIWVGSLAGRLPLPFQAYYSASKAAIAALSDALRLELAPFGVQVTCIEPGDFKSSFTRSRSIMGALASPYADAAARCLAAVAEHENGGEDPERVADLVASLLQRRRLPARVPVGRWATLTAWAAKLAPAWVRERAIAAYCRL